MREGVIQAIEIAFADVPPPEGGAAPALSPGECHELVDELLVLQPGHLQWILPQIMIDLLRNPDRPNAQGDLFDVVDDLNVERIGAESFYADLGPGDVAYY